MDQNHKKVKPIIRFITCSIFFLAKSWIYNKFEKSDKNINKIKHEIMFNEAREIDKPRLKRFLWWSI